MPVFSKTEHDNLIWSLSNKYIYMVRSVYHFIMNTILYTKHLKVLGNWMDIWNLHIPPKFKHFLWRLLRGCLPTWYYLTIKVSIALKNSFFVFHVHAENKWHMFFDCPKEKRFWQTTGIWNMLKEKSSLAQDTINLIFLLL